jgi:hypothetical protein
MDLFKGKVTKGTIPNCLVYFSNTLGCYKCNPTFFLSVDGQACVQQCDETNETEILQDIKFSADLMKTTISKVSFCTIKLSNCKKGTFLAYYNEQDKLLKQFVCLECDSDKFKIIKIHRYIFGLPFDVEEPGQPFHRNILTPYFICGDVNTPIDKCQYYMDYTNLESSYNSISFLIFS